MQGKPAALAAARPLVAGEAHVRLETMKIKGKAKLTRAGFLGDVVVHVHPEGIWVVGHRIAESFVVYRKYSQWVIGLVGAGVFFSGRLWGFYIILSAWVFSLVSYLWFWWASKKETVAFRPGEHTKASRGKIGSMSLVTWLKNPIMAVLHQSEISWLNARTVVFEGPSGEDKGRKVIYRIVTNEKGDSGRMISGLLGIEEKDRVGS